MSKWQYVSLKDIALIGDGAHASLKRVDKGILYLTSKNFKPDGIYLNVVDYISEETYHRYFKNDSKSLTKPKSGDVLLSIIGTMGAPYLVKKDDEFGLSSSVSIIRSKEIDSKYLYYWIKSPMFQGAINQIKNGVAQSFLSLPMIGSLPVNYPELYATQQKIAKILSNYDDLIENNLKRIYLLEESARLTYEEWFLRFRIDGKKLDIDPKSGLPFGWRITSVTQCDAFMQDKGKIKEFKGNKTYYATADVDGTEITGDGEIINSYNKPSRAQIMPSNNTVWFARMSNTHKVLCFNNKNTNIQSNSILSSGFAGFKAKSNSCLPFLYFTINSTFFNELKNLYSTGSTQVSLNNESMDYIKVIEPSSGFIEKYGEKILPMIEEVSTLRSKNQLLKEARDILLPRLMTGMINTDDTEVTA